MSVALQAARESDLPAVARIMNAAFRGAGGEQGWSVESAYIQGERTNEALLREEIASGSLYLLAKDARASALSGCVSLRPMSKETWYLGSLAVAPGLQNAGFGRELLQAAEDYVASRGAHTVEISVVNVRDTLIAWYERRGYVRTGEMRPFPYNDHRYGTPQRQDLEFVVLTRQLDRH